MRHAAARISSRTLLCIGTRPLPSSRSRGAHDSGRGGGGGGVCKPPRRFAPPLLEKEGRKTVAEWRERAQTTRHLRQKKCTHPSSRRRGAHDSGRDGGNGRTSCPINSGRTAVERCRTARGGGPQPRCL